VEALPHSLAATPPRADLGQAQRSADYWDARARKFAMHGGGLAAVCSYGMPSFYNRYIEICQRRALGRWLKRAAPAASVLDVGCGVGRWSLDLARLGHDVTGVDLSPCMIERAASRAAAAGAHCEFLVSDAATLTLDRTFDSIFCVTVLQHIMDPRRAQIALERLCAHLKPRGRLILLEAAPTRATSRCDTTVFQARTLDWYEDALRRAGLRLTAQHGVDPMPLKTWLLPAYRRLPTALGTAALALTTAVSLPLDWLLGRALTRFSWHKVLVAER
jgi:2-polyprenyl-3-methyl-5-hydroxy-6-metoxy-1,4-benzoquinol methylase